MIECPEEAEPSDYVETYPNDGKYIERYIKYVFKQGKAVEEKPVVNSVPKEKNSEAVE